MRLLSVWLLFVAFCRLSSVYFGYFNVWGLNVAVYSITGLTDVHGRTFSAWTAITCLLCVLCAMDLENRSLYLATLLSFVIAFLHFVLEFLVFGSMTLSNFATVGFFAVTSLVWMSLEFPWDVRPTTFPSTPSFAFYPSEPGAGKRD
eukprot:TRINITY_DN8678_c0_g1_i1.p1 TRINITY_DN8678_c0_g1~~TRINITY_DN8678_c0_g1_i1.p1  ORF type:complete len:147 (+),score=35.42 TRINITY_DN8678_c0_g1_i1:158-598(+)